MIKKKNETNEDEKKIKISKEKKDAIIKAGTTDPSVSFSKVVNSPIFTGGA